jgi:hypothetical protein
MHKFMSSVAAILIGSAFGMAEIANSAPIGRAGAGHGPGVAGAPGVSHPGSGVHAFHGIGHPGFRSFHGYPGYPGYPGYTGYFGYPGYWGLYPNTLFGYPNYNSYWGYPYSLYEDDSGCRFEWPKRTGKLKTVQRGVWTCS